jgi:hypothetical protein
LNAQSVAVEISLAGGRNGKSSKLVSAGAEETAEFNSSALVAVVRLIPVSRLGNVTVAFGATASVVSLTSPLILPFCATRAFPNSSAKPEKRMRDLINGSALLALSTTCPNGCQNSQPQPRGSCAAVAQKVLRPG